MIHDLFISIQDLLSPFLSHWKSILGTIAIVFTGMMLVITLFEEQ